MLSRNACNDDHAAGYDGNLVGSAHIGSGYALLKTIHTFVWFIEMAVPLYFGGAL